MSGTTRPAISAPGDGAAGQALRLEAARTETMGLRGPHWSLIGARHREISARHHLRDRHSPTDRRARPHLRRMLALLTRPEEPRAIKHIAMFANPGIVPGGRLVSQSFPRLDGHCAPRRIEHGLKGCDIGRRRSSHSSARFAAPCHNLDLPGRFHAVNARPRPYSAHFTPSPAQRSAHWLMLSTMAWSSRPFSVRRYSTRTGISG